MNYENIVNALFAYLDSVSGLPTICWPNISAETPTENHLTVWILPSETETIGLNSTNMAKGIFQIDVNVKDSEGIIKSSAIVDDVLIAFARGTELTEGSTTVRIDEAASVANGTVEEGWFTAHISVPFYSIF